MATKVNPALADMILDSLNDGLSVCDTDRKILYWSKSAEHITGWIEQEVVGHHCRDNIAVHGTKMAGNCARSSRTNLLRRTFQYKERQWSQSSLLRHLDKKLTHFSPILTPL